MVARNLHAAFMDHHFCRSVIAHMDVDGRAANADNGCRCLEFDVAVDRGRGKSHDAAHQFDGAAVGVRVGIVDEFIQHDFRFRAHRQSRLVPEPKVGGTIGANFDPLVSKDTFVGFETS